MNTCQWHRLLHSLDTSQFTGPVRECVEQLLTALAQDDYLLVGALAKLSGDIARACDDRPGQAASMIFAAVAGAAFDRSSLALELLTRARLGFSSHHTAAARQNQCVADLCYGVVLDDQLRNQGKPQQRSVLRDALARVQEALRLIDSVCREHARTGDVARYSSADDLRDWARCGLFSELSRAFFGTRQSDTLSHRLAAGDGGQRPLTALRFGYGNNPPLDHRRVFDREEVEVQGAWLVT